MKLMHKFYRLKIKQKNCQLRIGSGVWNDERFESGIVDLSYSKEGIEIQSAEFKNNMNFEHSYLRKFILFSNLGGCEVIILA